MAQNIITNHGLEKPSLNDCIQQIGDALEAEIGQVNREADSVTGQWIGVEAEASAVHFEALEFLWSSRFINTATGYALDAIGQWVGVSRRSKSYTKVNAVVFGRESTSVPDGSIAASGNHQFKIDSDTVITRSNLISGTFSVDNNNQESYQIRINGNDYSYKKKDTDTLINIAAGMSELIDSGGLFTASTNGSTVILTSSNLIQGYPVSLSAGLNWSRIGSPAAFTATESGSIHIKAGDLKTPVSAVAGWDGVSNLVDGSTGSDRESDESYRNRLLKSRNGSVAAATSSAIESRLISEVDGVTLVHVIENSTMQTVENMPPKSINVIVEGGSEQEIANAIWQYKAAGIETYGQIRLTAYDRYGKAHDVQFSRPSDVDLYVKVTVSALNNEESLPANIISAIKGAVSQYIATLGLGEDVITQRLYGYIYSATTGIGKMTVTISTDGQTYSEDNLVIAEGERVNLNTDNIEVSGV